MAAWVRHLLETSAHFERNGRASYTHSLGLASADVDNATSLFQTPQLAMAEHPRNLARASRDDVSDALRPAWVERG
jgi:hypothetical protein